MTRADLLALRAGFALRPGCHYIVTDGPFIGTTGNQSATVIEMHAISNIELSQNVSVQTSFSPSAFVGQYDIDLGTAGSITELTDSWGNTVKDPDADSPTVQTGFPWHRGASNFRDNYVEDSTLTGWDVGTGTVSRNRVVSSTVDLTGAWLNFSDNRVQGATVTLTKDTGTRAFTGNEVYGGAVVRALLGSTGTVSISDNRFLDGYVTEVAATSTSIVTIDGSTFSGHGGAATDCLIDGAGSRIFGDTVSYAHPSLQQYTLTGAGGTVSINTSELNGGRLVRDAATTAGAALAQVRGTGHVVQGAGATGGSLALSATELGALALQVSQNGPGALTTNTCRLLGQLVVSASATRGLGLVSTNVGGGSVVTQNRTGGTATDQVLNTELGSLVTLNFNGAVDPGGSQTPVNRCSFDSNAQITLTDPVGTGGVCLQATRIDTNAIVTGTGTGLVQACRFSLNSSVNLGAFAHDRTIIEDGQTHTLTATNTLRLANKSFNDLLGV